MAKNNQKCVRISNEILNIVESNKGDGFNEKFENLVLEFHNTIPKRKAELYKIDKLIKVKEKQLNELEERINKLNNIYFELEQIKKLIFQVNNNAVNVPIVSQSDNLDQLQQEFNEIQPRDSIGRFSKLKGELK